MRPSFVRLYVALLAMEAAAISDGEVCGPKAGDLVTMLQRSSQADPLSHARAQLADETAEVSSPPPTSPGEGEGDSDPEKPDAWADSLLELSATPAPAPPVSEASSPPPTSPGEGEGDSDPEKPDAWADSLLELSATPAPAPPVSEASSPPPTSPGEGEGDSDPEKPDAWADSLLELSATPASAGAAIALTQLLQKEDAGSVAPSATDFKPFLLEDDSVKTAKIGAIDGICLLHTTAERLKDIFETHDANGDGKLSTSTEIPPEGGAPTQEEELIGLAQWLNDSLPEASTFCAPPLPDHLCDGVQQWRQQISQGVKPSDFLTLCGNEALLWPRANMSAPKLVVTGAEVANASLLVAGVANASLLTADDRTKFTKLSKRAKKAGNQIAWGAMMKGVNKLMIADYCYRDLWARGAAGRVCKSGWYQGSIGLDSGLCYQHCPSGRYRLAGTCWRSCPSNMNDLGVYCQREYWGECCHNTWWGRVCHGCPKIEVRDKDPQHSPGCSILSDDCSTCPSGHYGHGWLCYKHAKPNYDCDGAELICHRKCTAPLAENCGPACALDRGSCVSNTIEIVVGITEAAIQTASLVMSFGASAAATVMSAPTKAAMKQAAMKSAREVAERVGKSRFKAELKESFKRSIRKTIKENKRGNIDEKMHELLIAYATDNSDSLMDAYIEKAQQNGDSPWLTVIKDVDPTGLATAIDSFVDAEDTNVQVANWLNVFSVVDPTGILGAIAGVVQHSHCDGVHEKMQAIEDAPMDVPELKKTCADGILMEGIDAFLRGTWTNTGATRSNRPIYQKGSYFLYFWSAYGEWRFGPDHNSPASWVSSLNGHTMCPNQNTGWKVWRNQWVQESVSVLEE